MPETIARELGLDLPPAPPRLDSLGFYAPKMLPVRGRGLAAPHGDTPNQAKSRLFSRQAAKNGGGTERGFPLPARYDRSESVRMGVRKKDSLPSCCLRGN